MGNSQSNDNNTNHHPIRKEPLDAPPGVSNLVANRVVYRVKRNEARPGANSSSPAALRTKMSMKRKASRENDIASTTHSGSCDPPNYIRSPFRMVANRSIKKSNLKSKPKLDNRSSKPKPGSRSGMFVNNKKMRLPKVLTIVRKQHPKATEEVLGGNSKKAAKIEKGKVSDVKKEFSSIDMQHRNKTSVEDVEYRARICHNSRLTQKNVTPSSQANKHVDLEPPDAMDDFDLKDSKNTHHSGEPSEAPDGSSIDDACDSREDVKSSDGNKENTAVSSVNEAKDKSPDAQVSGFNAVDMSIKQESKAKVLGSNTDSDPDFECTGHDFFEHEDKNNRVQPTENYDIRFPPKRTSSLQEDGEVLDGITQDCKSENITRRLEVRDSNLPHSKEEKYDTKQISALDAGNKMVLGYTPRNENTPGALKRADSTPKLVNQLSQISFRDPQTPVGLNEHVISLSELGDLAQIAEKTENGNFNPIQEFTERSLRAQSHESGKQLFADDDDSVREGNHVLPDDVYSDTKDRYSNSDNIDSHWIESIDHTIPKCENSKFHKIDSFDSRRADFSHSTLKHVQRENEEDSHSTPKRVEGENEKGLQEHEWSTSHEIVKTSNYMETDIGGLGGIDSKLIKDRMLETFIVDSDVGSKVDIFQSLDGINFDELGVKKNTLMSTPSTL